MTVTTTKQFAFRDAFYDAIVAAIDADAAVGDVVVNRGYVDWAQVHERKSVEIGAMFDDTEWSALGNRKTQERFTVECRIVIQVESQGNDAMLTCEEDAQELFAIIETVARQNHQMRTNVADSTTYTVDWWIITDSNYGPFYNEQGRVGILEFTLAAHAQLPRQ